MAFAIPVSGTRRNATGQRLAEPGEFSGHQVKPDLIAFDRNRFVLDDKHL
jgi:hypothetical protein